jgi:cell division topological specificity factor
MSWFDKLFKKEKNSAKVAKDRLMIAIATDRQNISSDDIEMMRADIIRVLEKYIKIDGININKENKGDMELLEIEAVIKK